MTKSEFRGFLNRRLDIEKENGFRHCAVMLEEIIELYDMVDAPKKAAKKKTEKNRAVRGLR